MVAQEKVTAETVPAEAGEALQMRWLQEAGRRDHRGGRGGRGGRRQRGGGAPLAVARGGRGGRGGVGYVEGNADTDTGSATAVISLAQSSLDTGRPDDASTVARELQCIIILLFGREDASSSPVRPSVRIWRLCRWSCALAERVSDLPHIGEPVDPSAHCMSHVP
eukprot:7354471-Prymnesium_polylepis.2